MLKRFIWAALLVLASYSTAFAQSTASQVVPGNLTTTGCPSGSTVCFNQYSSSNPLPINPTPTNSTVNKTAVTVGTSSGQALAASTATVYLGLLNQSTATICINLGATATISGTTCAAGEITLPPLGGYVWETNYVPSDAVNAIASAASTPLTVLSK